MSFFQEFSRRVKIQALFQERENPAHKTRNWHSAITGKRVSMKHVTLAGACT
jgi:hypothetical protein